VSADGNAEAAETNAIATNSGDNFLLDHQSGTVSSVVDYSGDVCCYWIALDTRTCASARQVL
jgi:hypothetical protein